MLGLEVKDAKGATSEVQDKMHQDLCGAGVAVRTCRTVEEAIRAYLEAKGSPRGH
jgi:hypothetical protein